MNDIANSCALKKNFNLVAWMNTASLNSWLSDFCMVLSVFLGDFLAVLGVFTFQLIVFILMVVQ